MQSASDFLQALREGDPDAWQRFLDREGRLVLLVAHRMGLNHDDAEDVFQNAFFKVHRGLDSLRDAERLTSWVYSIAYNESVRVRNRLTLESGVSAEADFGEVLDTQPAPDYWVERLDLSQRVERALEALEPRCQKLLRALYSGPGLPYNAVAQELGVPLGSIGPTRARCLDRLRKQLGLEGLEPEERIELRGSTKEPKPDPSRDSRGAGSANVSKPPVARSTKVDGSAAETQGNVLRWPETTGDGESS